MDFRLRRQSLLERAGQVEEAARRVNNAQVQDLMRALAALYREMAEELDDRALFERRFSPLDFADLAGGDLAGGDRLIIAGPIIRAGHGAP